MDQLPNGEQGERAIHIEALKTELLSRLHTRFSFGSDPSEDDSRNHFTLSTALDDTQRYSYNDCSRKLPISEELLIEDRHEEPVTAVSVSAVLSFDARVTEPAHWKRILLRKQYVPDQLERTDTLQSISLSIDVTQQHLGLDRWFVSYLWDPLEKPKRQLKELRAMLETLDVIDSHIAVTES